MYTCPPDFSCLLHPFCIVTCKHGWYSVAMCVCYNEPTSSPTPSLACGHASVHVLISTWLPMSVHPLSIVTWNHGYPWMTLCVSQSSYFQHLGKDVVMHHYMYLCPPDSLCQIHSYHLFRTNVVLCPINVPVSCVWEKILKPSVIKAKKVYHFN